MPYSDIGDVYLKPLFAYDEDGLREFEYHQEYLVNTEIDGIYA